MFQDLRVLHGPKRASQMGWSYVGTIQPFHSQRNKRLNRGPGRSILG